MREILIVGRGPSIYQHDWDAVAAPIMAVSSGIFAVPADRPVSEFVTMDPLKFYMAGLVDSSIAWSNDANAVHCPFWRDASIRKHVLGTRLAPGTYRTMPSEVWDVIPARHIGKFQRAFSSTLHAFGFQPSWGDYQNCRGWNVAVDDPPNMGDNGTDRLGLDSIRNSWMMAVQVAVQLGYRRLLFAGCDFRDNCGETIVAAIRRWHGLYAEAGVEWVNLSPDSRLAEFMPTVEGVVA